MKKTTQNVRRSLRRVLTLLLALVMTLSLAVQAFAAIGNWPATGDTTVDRYMQNSGTFYNGDTVIAPKYSNFGGFINVYGVPKGSAASAYVMTPTSVDFGDLKSSKNNTVDLELNRAYDFSEPIRYHITSENGRTFFAYAFAAEATSKDTWTEADTQALLGMAGLFVDTYHQLYLTIDKINASRTEIGTYDDAGKENSWDSGKIMCAISPGSEAQFIVTGIDGLTKEYTIAITRPNVSTTPVLEKVSVERTSDNAATVKFTSSMAGNYFYKVVDKGAAAPTVDTTRGGTTAVKGENTITLTNLSTGARDIYIVVKSLSNVECDPFKIEIPAYGSTETPDEGDFTITVNAPPTGGTIATNRTRANEGDEIIVTVTPKTGYQMKAGSLRYAFSAPGAKYKTITGNSFKMPGGDVSITCDWETASTTVNGITAFSINGVAGAVNNSTNTITITMPRGTDVTKLTPVIATNGVKSLTPGNGETVDFTNAVTYTAAMEDGSSKTYTVTVYVDKGTLADQFWDKLTDFATQVPWWQYAEKQQSTSKYPKYW